MQFAATAMLPGGMNPSPTVVGRGDLTPPQRSILIFRLLVRGGGVDVPQGGRALIVAMKRLMKWSGHVNNLKVVEND